MKTKAWLGVAGAVAVVMTAAVTAGHMGETSHAFAKGRVLLAPELVDKAKGIKTLFIIATQPGQGMPLGAFRKTLSSDATGDVYTFVLTKENMQRMQMDMEWPEEFKLKARLDRDGAAGPDQPGDLVGEVFPVQLGQEGCGDSYPNVGSLKVEAALPQKNHLRV